MPEVEIENVSSKDRTKEITDKLEQGIKDLFQGDKFRNYLNTMSKFHNYSFNNTMLIAMQKPDATLVAGYSLWKNKFSRNVNKGEKGIQIFAPAPYTIKKERPKIDKDTKLPVLDKDGKPEIEEYELKIPAFKVVSVFDVSQTSGKELPSLGVDELKGDVKDYEKFFDALKNLSPVPIRFENIKDGSKGYFDKDENIIAINEGMSEVQTVKTAVHEIAHSLLHSRDLKKSDIDMPKDRNTEEVEAESIAYTVCQHFGIDTSDYSFSYVASWGTGLDIPELKASLETIRATANDIINKAEDFFISHQQEQTQVQTENLPKAKEQMNIIGNTPFKDIQDKNFIKMSTPKALAVAKILEDKGVKFSGRINEDKTTLTISKSDLPVYNEAVASLNETKAAEKFPEPKVTVECHPQLDNNFILKEAATGGTKQEIIDFCKENLAASVPIPQLKELIDHVQGKAPTVDHKNISVYLKTSEEAVKLDQIELYRQNRNENQSCLKSISKAFYDNYHLSGSGFGGSFDSAGALKQMMMEYPLDRISLLTASRISNSEWDKRFSDDVVKWAKEVISPLPDEVKADLKYCQTNEHSGLVNLFAKSIMAKQLEIKNTVQKEADISPKKSFFEEREERFISQEPEKISAFLNSKEDAVAIFQLQHKPENYDISFAGMDYLKKKGLEPQRDNYTLIYTYKEDLSDIKSIPAFLESVFGKFNTKPPKDFEGHSLSVSDIVAVKKDGEITAHFVDNIGYEKLPQFEIQSKDNPLKSAEEAVEQNDNMIDGIINNKPVADEMALKTGKKAEQKTEAKRSIIGFLRQNKERKVPDKKDKLKLKGANYNFVNRKMKKFLRKF